LPPAIVLVDSMIVIEAVRTGCWNAISGQLPIVTVERCEEELLSGDPSEAGYVPVTRADLARVRVDAVAPVAAAAFRLQYPDADGLDDGERALLAHAARLAEPFEICSCDKAAVRAAHALGWLDRVVSLESLAGRCGARANPPLRRQFTEAVLSEWRTKLALGVAL
jgi:hypothetical protein